MAGAVLDGLSSDGPARSAGSGRRTAVVRRLPPCAWRTGAASAARRAGSNCGCHPLASATDGGSSRGRFASDRVRARPVSCFGRRQRMTGARLSAAGSVVARVSAGVRKREAPAFAAMSRSARKGVGCTVRGTYVVWWSHQLRNTAPTPFLYQGRIPITTKNRTGTVVGAGFISAVLPLY